MNVEYFISKRLINTKKNKNVFSRPIVRITISAIALSVAVMIISLSTLFGFKKEITDQIININSHIEITSNKYDSLSEYRSPILATRELKKSILKNKEVVSIREVVYEYGLIKTSDEFLGVRVKGIVPSEWKKLEENILSGKIIDSENSILISSSISKKLRLGVGDSIYVYFPSSKERLEKTKMPNVKHLKVCGIYKTSMSEFDTKLVFANIDKLRKIKSWDDSDVELLEVSVKDLKNVNRVRDELSVSIDRFFNKNVDSINDLYPEIFDWLDLQDINVRIIIILMILVCVMNIISSILILVLERTRLIGILKSIGCLNWSIRKIFIYNAMYFVFRGLLWGNLIAFFLLFIQYNFNILKLDEEMYYMDTIAVSFNLLSIIILNLGVALVCFLMMIIPSIIITKISVVKAIRFN